MFGWCATPHLFFGFWWWIIPLFFMILCIAFCLFGRNGRGMRWCCGGWDRATDLDEVKKEIRELKQRIGSVKQGEGGSNG